MSTTTRTRTEVQGEQSSYLEVEIYDTFKILHGETTNAEGSLLYDGEAIIFSADAVGETYRLGLEKDGEEVGFTHLGVDEIPEDINEFEQLLYEENVGRYLESSEEF